jgi:GNAT superfamily N-acetyltransferase
VRNSPVAARRVEIRPFDDAHIDGASRVLERCHREHLAREPLLARDVDYQSLLQQERVDATGAVALSNGHVVGYLLDRHASGHLGPHVWSTAAGQAADSADVVSDLYDLAAARWVDEGLTRHFVFVVADHRHVEPWFRLGFGASAFQAVRPIPGPPVPADVHNVEVRLSQPADLNGIARVARELPLHMRASPSFGELTVPSEEDLREEWRGTWERRECTHFVAVFDEQVVGQLLLYRRPVGDLRTPPNSIDLSLASSLPARRGSGVGLALTSAAIAWSSDQALTAMTIDWRATNLLAARFWPNRGFRATHLRLFRSIR